MVYTALWWETVHRWMKSYVVSFQPFHWSLFAEKETLPYSSKFRTISSGAMSSPDFHADFFVDRGRSTQSFSLWVVAPQFLHEPFLKVFWVWLSSILLCDCNFWFIIWSDSDRDRKWSDFWILWCFNVGPLFPRYHGTFVMKSGLCGLIIFPSWSRSGAISPLCFFFASSCLFLNEVGAVTADPSPDMMRYPAVRQFIPSSQDFASCSDDR